MRELIGLKCTNSTRLLSTQFRASQKKQQRARDYFLLLSKCERMYYLNADLLADESTCKSSLSSVMSRCKSAP